MAGITAELSDLRCFEKPFSQGAEVDIQEILELDRTTRVNLLQDLTEIIEGYFARVHEKRVAPEITPEEIRSRLKPFDFSQPLDPQEMVNVVVESLWNYQVHTPHPRYFGLFNPAPTAVITSLWAGRNALSARRNSALPVVPFWTLKIRFVRPAEPNWQ